MTPTTPTYIMSSLKHTASVRPIPTDPPPHTTHDPDWYTQPHGKKDLDISAHIISQNPRHTGPGPISGGGGGDDVVHHKRT
jgi:hypothetical protein